MRRCPGSGRPQASRSLLRGRFRLRLGVIITDTLGWPWRQGPDRRRDRCRGHVGDLDLPGSAVIIRPVGKDMFRSAPPRRAPRATRRVSPRVTDWIIPVPIKGTAGAKSRLDASVELVLAIALYPVEAALRGLACDRRNGCRGRSRLRLPRRAHDRRPGRGSGHCDRARA
jgi:hypothetical protein